MIFLDILFTMMCFPCKSCDRSVIPKISDIERVDYLERIPCNVTREYFMENYEMERKPVMLVSFLFHMGHEAFKFIRQQCI